MLRPEELDAGETITPMRKQREGPHRVKAHEDTKAAFGCQRRDADVKGGLLQDPAVAFAELPNDVA